MLQGKNSHETNNKTLIISDLENGDYTVAFKNRNIETRLLTIQITSDDAIKINEYRLKPKKIHTLRLKADELMENPLVE
jgi:hypothetical protein